MGLDKYLCKPNYYYYKEMFKAAPFGKKEVYFAQHSGASEFKIRPGSIL